MISVGLFNESFAPQVDGVAVTVENYARIINEKHGKSCVVVPKVKSRKTNKYPYKIYQYPSTRIQVAGQYNIGVPVSMSLYKKLMDKDMGLIHSHCPFGSGLYAQFISAKKAIPHISSFHTKFKDDVNRRIRFNSEWPGEIVAKQVVAFYNQCDYVWAVSNGTARTLKNYGYQGDIHVMPNGCDIPASYKNPLIKQQVLKKFDFKSDAPLLLFVGRHTWVKNTRIIIEALGALSRHKKEFNMLFVGSGEDKSAMEKLVKRQDIENKVRFAGNVMDRNQLREIYMSSDLFLFPSVYDNAPLVVREAAACGCPSLLIENSNSAESALDGVNAFLSNESVEDFALTLNAALESNNLEKVGENARRDMYISWEDVVEMVVREYQRVIDDFVPTNKSISSRILDYANIAKNHNFSAYHK